MKKYLVILLVLCFVAVEAQAVDWSDPLKVAARYSHGGVIAVEDGKVGIADATKVGTKLPVFYNEFTYSGYGALTQAITDDVVVAGGFNYDLSFQGIGLDNGSPVIALTPTPVGGATMTRVRVYTKSGGWSYVDGTSTIKSLYNGRAYREAFRLDSSDKPYLVYTDGNSNAITLATAASSTSTTWTETAFSPAVPLTDAAAKLVIDEGAATSLQISYRGGRAVGGPGFFSYDGTASYDTGLSSSTAKTKSDIAIGADGNPIVVGLVGGGQGIKAAFYDDTTSSYTNSLVVAAPDPKKVGWYNTADAIDIEIDGQGRPVVLVATVDDTSAITEAYLDYYVYENDIWTGENILTTATTTYLRNMDLIFDESGRAFITFNGEIGGSADRDLYLLSAVPEPATMILLLGGALGMAIRRKK